MTRDRQEDFDKLSKILREQGEQSIVFLVESLGMDYVKGLGDYVVDLMSDWIKNGRIERTKTGLRWIEKKQKISIPDWDLSEPTLDSEIKEAIRKILLKHRDKKDIWTPQELSEEIYKDSNPEKVSMVDAMVKLMVDVQKVDDGYKLYDRDFITNMSALTIRNIEMVQEEWATLQATSLLGTFLGNTIIVKKSPVRLNLYILMIALSGIRKSLPIQQIFELILKKVGEILKKDFKLPTKSSVEGFITKMDEDGNHEGVIVAHEFSGVFKQARQDGYQSDALEFMSENYDGIAYDRTTITHGQQKVENVYVNILSATTPYFLKKVMDEDFFTQGTGNRFIYNYFDIEDVKLPSEKEEDIEKDVENIFSEKEYNVTKADIENYAKELAMLYGKVNKWLTKLIMSKEAGIMWRKFEIKSLKKWKQLMKDTFNWKGNIVNRYPLMALKLSGIYCVSRNYDAILRAQKKEDLQGITITKEDMERAIDTVMLHHKHLKQLLLVREKVNVKQEEVKSYKDRARAFIMYLKEFPNDMAKQGDLFRIQTITTNSNMMARYLEIALDEGWYKVVDKTTIKDKEEMKRLGVGTRSVVYQWVK